MAFYRSQNTQEVPINICGSSIFGRYPKISTEKTLNMLISDNALVPYPGYLSIDGLRNLGDNGRGIFTSNVFDCVIAVIGNIVYKIIFIYNPFAPEKYSASKTQVGTINSFTTDVFIAEDNLGHILISDGTALYSYQPNESSTFIQLTLDFQPGPITFHDSRFIATSVGTNQWRLSDIDGSGDVTFPNDDQHVGLLQTKPNNVVAVASFPSRGNMILVFGENVTEFWFDVGYQLFPYQRNTNADIDYGCVNPSTIASLDEVVVWLAQNEKSGPVIMYSTGGTPERISTDGIDYLLANLANPQDSEGFIYRQYGHLIYHINFIEDNVSLFYDFNTQKFFNASDEDSNYYIAKQVAFFNNQYYFVTRNNGDVYAMDSFYTTYDGKIIPRIRICKNIRALTQDYFTVTDIGFTIEQGDTNPVFQNPGNVFLITEDGRRLRSEYNFTPYLYLVTNGPPVYDETYPRVDLSFSIDGGASFSQGIGYDLNPLGHRVNKLLWWRLGLANDWTPQFRFWSTGRVVAFDGVAHIRS